MPNNMPRKRMGYDIEKEREAIEAGRRELWSSLEQQRKFKQCNEVGPEIAQICLAAAFYYDVKTFSKWIIKRNMEQAKYDRNFSRELNDVNMSM